MVAVLAEVLNFTTMLSLFANSPLFINMNDEERTFEVWIFIEALVIVSTVLTNVLFLMVRSVRRNQFDISLDPYSDNQKDFLSAEENQLFINYFN